MKTWLLDTGPLIALLARDDFHHVWAVEQSKEAPSTVFTCEAVISEAAFLMKRAHHPVDDIFALLDVGFLQVEFSMQPEARAVRKLLHRYRDQPMSLADACLVRMAELRPEAVIWTVDGDFRVYRKEGRQSLSLVIPD